MALARFRADPTKVRTSLRWVIGSELWCATVQSREDGTTYTYECTKPTTAMFRALDMAEFGRVEGIDLDMMWSYKHPHKAV